MHVPWLSVVSVCILGVLLAPLASHAQHVCAGSVAVYEPYDSESLAIAGAAVPLTPAKIPPAPPSGDTGMAFITIEGNTISWSVTGTPTAVVGHQSLAGQSLTLCGRATLFAFRAIRLTADATLKVTYFRAR